MKYLHLVFAILLLAATIHADSLSDLRGLKTRNSRFPLFHNGKLQVMIFSAEAERNGGLLASTRPVLDIIRGDADVDDVLNSQDVQLYPLNAGFGDILKFWKPRLYSEGVITSAKADIDMENRLAGGGAPVFFRSPLIDLDGVGFDANFNKRTVLVKKNVRIVLRMNASDPREILKKAKLPPKYEFLTASSNSMLIDMDKKEITLFGNVVVNEPRATVTCDKLIIFLAGNRPAAPAAPVATAKKALPGVPALPAAVNPLAPPPAAAPKSEGVPGMDVNGVSRVVCEGNVVITRRHDVAEAKAPLQQGSADRVVYDMAQGLLTMTGLPGRFPMLQQGDNRISGSTILFRRAQNQLEVLRNCRMLLKQPDRPDAAPAVLTSENMRYDIAKNHGVFSGNVNVDDDRMNLKCADMRVRFAAKPGTPGGKKAAEANASDSALLPEISQSGARELQEVICEKNVRVTRKQKTPGAVPETARADRAVLNYPEKKITMTGGTPSIARGKDVLSGKELVLHFNEERLVSPQGGKIVMNSISPVKESDSPFARFLQTQITSQSSDLNYGGNLLTFKGNVKVRDPRLSLDCDLLQVYLKSEPGAATAKIDPDNPFGNGARNKAVDRVVCTGRVYARDSRAKLNTDKLTLIFNKLPPGAAPKKKSAEGVFQAGGTELARIETDGNVRLENIPEPAPEKTADAKKADGNPDSPLGMFKSDNSRPMVLTADQGMADLKKNRSEFHGNVVVKETEGELKSDSLYFNAENAQSPTLAAAGRHKPVAKIEDEDIDADPLAPNRESEVPAQLLLGAGRRLRDVTALRNVVISRYLNGKLAQRAVGDKAHYVVADRRMTLTGTPEEMPVLTDAAQGRMVGRRVIADLAKEEMYVEENTSLDINLKSGGGPAAFK